MSDRISPCRYEPLATIFFGCQAVLRGAGQGKIRGEVGDARAPDVPV